MASAVWWCESYVGTLYGNQNQKWESEYDTKRGKGKLIATQEQIHQELLQEYGGGYESAGDEYVDNWNNQIIDNYTLIAFT